MRLGLGGVGSGGYGNFVGRTTAYLLQRGDPVAIPLPRARANAWWPATLIFED